MGLVGPLLGLHWIPRFLRLVLAECNPALDRQGLPVADHGDVFSEEPERAARRGHFVLQNACLPLRCGGSTCAVLHLPWHKDRPTRRLTIVHELLHGIGKRLGYHLNEADWWLCTAAFVHLAVRAGRATWYPTWFVGAIPSEIVALWP